MRVTTVRSLRNEYLRVLSWVEAGEVVQIKRRGRVIARLTPETSEVAQRVDWSKSAAFRLKRKSMKKLSAKESSDLLNASRGER